MLIFFIVRDFLKVICDLESKRGAKRWSNFKILSCLWIVFEMVLYLILKVDTNLTVLPISLVALSLFVLLFLD